jgi:hypothetical protein
MARNWDSLSDSYRHRLERGGIDRNEYESGASLSVVRGHGLTRDALINDIQDYKADLYGGTRRWNEARSAKHIDRNDNGEKRSVKELKQILAVYKEAKRTDQFGHEEIYFMLREDDLEDAGKYH